jgi:hypothetical protein
MKLWDEAKNKINQQRHRLSFEVAVLVFNDERRVTSEDYLDANGEMRYQTIGLIGGLLILVAHVYRDIDGEEQPWLISARKVVKNEEQIYWSNQRKN